MFTFALGSTFTSAQSKEIPDSDCYRLFRMNFPPSSEDHQLYDMDQPPPQGNSGPPPGPPGGDGMNYGGGGYGAGGGGNMMSSKEQALMWQQVSHIFCNSKEVLGVPKIMLSDAF